MLCRICARPIVILIRQGTGICCSMCNNIEKGKYSYQEIVKFISEVNPTHLQIALEDLLERRNSGSEA